MGKYCPNCGNSASNYVHTGVDIECHNCRKYFRVEEIAQITADSTLRDIFTAFKSDNVPSKIAVIKNLRGDLALNLKDAKNLVDVMEALAKGLSVDFKVY